MLQLYHNYIILVCLNIRLQIEAFHYMLQNLIDDDKQRTLIHNMCLRKQGMWAHKKCLLFKL